MDVELRGRYEFAPKWNARFMLEMMRNFSGNSLMKDGEGSIKEFSFDGPMKLTMSPRMVDWLLAHKQFISKKVWL